jgi:hypothetical protein
MRRLAALGLILTAGWLVYQSGSDLVRLAVAGGYDRALGELGRSLPFAGGVLGLAGGMLAFFGGSGGVVLAVGGGLMTAGFSIHLGQSISGPNWHESDPALGLAMLVMALLAALVGPD